MNEVLALLDDFDIQILNALHEFEFDPNKGERHRTSPVPAYVIFAATSPMTYDPRERRTFPTYGPSVVARLEALCMLGLTQRTEQQLISFGLRELRNGRFIDIECENGVETRSEKSRMFLIPWVEFHIRFGPYAEFSTAYNNAMDEQPDGDQFDIIEAVLKEYDYMSCRFMNKEKEREWYQALAIKGEPSENQLGNCYALTADGIRMARLTRNPEGEKRVEDKQLLERHSNIIVAMHELGADSWERRKNAEEIAKKAIGEANANKVKKDLADLKRWGYAESQGGPGGGSWLTPAGKHELPHRQNQYKGARTNPH